MQNYELISLKLLKINFKKKIAARKTQADAIFCHGQRCVMRFAFWCHEKSLLPLKIKQPIMNFFCFKNLQFI